MRFLCLLLALLINTTAAWAQFELPENMTFEDKTYQLAFVSPSQTSYEYTSAGETVDNWSTLLTLNYLKKIYISLPEYEKILKKSLKQSGSNVKFSLKIDQDVLEAKLLFLPIQPNSDNPLYNSYELSVKRVFSIPACGGLVEYQWSRRFAAQTELTEKAWLAKLRKILNQDAASIKRLNWTPDC